MGVRLHEISDTYLLLPDYIIGESVKDGAIPGYELTDEDNYIWTTENGRATILYYLGGSLTPQIPRYLDGALVTAVEATAFNYSDVIQVAMLDNITIIY